jgi:hypothetical protein
MASQFPQTNTLSTLSLTDEREYRAEYCRTLKSMKGPRDNGYTAAYILTPGEFDEMVMKAGELRRRIKARRLAQFEAFMRGE